MYFSDHLESIQTEDECMHDFLRLFQTDQQLNSLFSNGINYEQFRHGFHIVAYDLTSGMDAGTEAFSSPSVRVGKHFSIIQKVFFFTKKNTFKILKYQSTLH